MTTIERIAQAVNDAIQAALGVSLLDMVVQLLATVILVIIVKKYFYQKIVAFLEKRRLLMEQERLDSEKAKAEALAYKEQTESTYQHLMAEQKDIIRKAKEKGEFERHEILSKAKAEASELQQTSMREIEHEREKVREAMRHEVIDLAARMASKIIEEELDETKYEQMMMDQLEGSKKS